MITRVWYPDSGTTLRNGVTNQPSCLRYCRFPRAERSLFSKDKSWDSKTFQETGGLRSIKTSHRRIIGISKPYHFYAEVVIEKPQFRILERRKREGGDIDMTDVLDNFQKKARDHARVPMQVHHVPLNNCALTR